MTAELRTSEGQGTEARDVVALGEHITLRLRRWRSTAVPILQAALAAGLSWLVAAQIVDHRAPFFAPVAAVVCLGLTLGQRLRRMIRLLIGVGLGVEAGDLLIYTIGTGPWQIALVVALAMSVAVLVDSGAVITGQAAVSAILVATLCLPGATSGIDRLVDGLVGGRPASWSSACFREAHLCIRHRRDGNRVSTWPS